MSTAEIATAEAPQVRRALGAPLVEVRNLRKYFPITEGIFVKRAIANVKAVDDVSFTIRKGETLGVVASPAAARRRPAAASCSWSGPHRDRSCTKARTWGR